MESFALLHPAAPVARPAREMEGARWVEQHGWPLLVLDCGVLRARYRSLADALPGVRLHYAIKALPEVAAIESLAQQGAHFEIASEGAIHLLRAAGVGPRRTIHTHPIKRPRDVVAALRFGITTFVVDNAHEIDEMIGFRDRVELMLRVGFRSPDAHVHAIDACNEMIRDLSASGDRKLTVLDIGGGFPVDYDGTTPSIDALCAPIRSALARLPAWTSVFAEPGRFLAAPAMTGFSTVIGKAERSGTPWYFLDDGVYGSFTGRIYDHTTYPITVSRRGPTRASVLAGPTCDGIDGIEVVTEGIQLPELEIGDLVVARTMGAYTSASATRFYSLPKTKILVLNPPRRATGRSRARSGGRTHALPSVAAWAPPR